MRAAELNQMIDKDLLFDFYGELLTAHQKKIFEKVVFDDCSVSEVGRDEGISRQGISDLIRRTTEQLETYEEKLRLVEKFRRQKMMIEEIRHLSERGTRTQDLSLYADIRNVSIALLKET